MKVDDLIKLSLDLGRSITLVTKDPKELRAKLVSHYFPHIDRHEGNDIVLKSGLRIKVATPEHQSIKGMMPNVWHLYRGNVSPEKR